MVLVSRYQNLSLGGGGLLLVLGLVHGAVLGQGQPVHAEVAGQHLGLARQLLAAQLAAVAPDLDPAQPEVLHVLHLVHHVGLLAVEGQEVAGGESFPTNLASVPTLLEPLPAVVKETMFLKSCLTAALLTTGRANVPNLLFFLYYL